MKLRMGLGLTVALICGMAYADEQPTPGYEQLKFLEPLIGTWTADLVAPQDYPTTGIKAGTKGQFSITYEWCNNKNGILIREQGTWKGSTETIEYGVALIGWDHAAKEIIAKRLGNKTGWSTPIYSKTDNGWVVHSAKTNPDGVIVREDYTLKLSGDTLVAQAINRFADDKKLDDGIVLEFKRKK